jgi:dihydrofolate reductase
MIASMMTSLDGYVEGPHRELDWATEGAEFEEYIDDTMERTEVMIFGRLAYDGLSKYWPAAEANPRRPWEAGVARKMNSLPKVVLSRTLERAEWSNTRIVRDQVRDAVGALKERASKNVMVFGGAGVIASLRQLDLIDEYRLIVHPIVLGSGTPFFADVQGRLSLRHSRSTRFASGLNVLCYSPSSQR